MRKPLKLPPGLTDTLGAAALTNLSASSLKVYRLPDYQKLGPPHHVYDGRPVYVVEELLVWQRERADKLRARADRLAAPLRGIEP